jgi:hypothetical protein
MFRQVRDTGCTLACIVLIRQLIVIAENNHLSDRIEIVRTELKWVLVLAVAIAVQLMSHKSLTRLLLTSSIDIKFQIKPSSRTTCARFCK